MLLPCYIIYLFIYFKANGGNGYSHPTRGGGGGSGGRIALYYRGGFFDGVLEAAGGKGNVENGAAGTVYVEKPGNISERAHRTLRVDNSGRPPVTERINQVTRKQTHGEGSAKISNFVEFFNVLVLDKNA